MTGFIYPVIVAWTWGGGYLTLMGFLDLAGSGVVHLCGGASGFAGAAILGPRLGLFDTIGKPDKRMNNVHGDMSEDTYQTICDKVKGNQWTVVRLNQTVQNYQLFINMSEVSTAHSPQNVALGTLILWLGWLLFNGGSSGSIVGDGGKAAELIIVNTIIAPSAAGIVTFFVKPYICPAKQNVLFDFQGITNGILAGLVSITAGCDVVETWAAFCIGIIGSFVYCFSCLLMQKMKVDDPLEATQVHGFCGIWGCIAIAFFA